MNPNERYAVHKENRLKSGSFPLFPSFFAGLSESLDWPLLRWLRPVPRVQLFDPERIGGQRLRARYVACCLPAERVLAFDQALPDLPAEELDRALSFEVERVSPFASGETAWGWRLLERRDEGVRVRMALAAKSDVEYLLAELSPALRARTEVWAEQDLPLKGYGEVRRLAAIRRRTVLRVGLLGAVCCGFLLLAVMPFLQTRAVVFDAQAQFERLMQSAAQPLAERDALVQTHVIGDAVHIQRQKQAALLPLLEVLSMTAPDSIHIANFEQRGRLVRLTGHGTNTSALVGRLGAMGEFAGLRTTSAIMRLSEDGAERFSVEFQFQAGGGS